MNMPPHRIAFIAVLLLLLAGTGAWWWETRIGPVTAASTPHPIKRRAIATSAVSIRRPGALADSAPDQSAAAFAQCGKAMTELMRVRAGQLAVKQDAKSQLAYALTTNMFQKERPAGTSAEDLMRIIKELQGKSDLAFARAQQLDPANPDIAWLAADHCFDWDSCQGVQQASQASEPDNVAVWLRAMDRASFRRDDAAMEAAFRHAIAAPRYDTHRGSGQLAVMEGYAGLPMPEVCNDPVMQEEARKHLPRGRSLDPSTFVQFMGLMGEQANVITGVALRDTCKAEDGGALASERRAGCINIFNKMADGDSLLERSIAMSQLIGLTLDTPAGIEWRERYRQMRWMIEQAGRGSPPLDVMDAAGREVVAYEAALRATGRWPAPADWLPNDERARSLIQTGHPPPPKQR